MASVNLIGRDRQTFPGCGPLPEVSPAVKLSK